MNTQQITYLAPEALVTGENVRFSLKKYRVDELARKITELGGVQTPLKVETIEGDSHHYRVREGHYRHAAALKLNKEGAGIKLPCIIEEPVEGLERLRKQLSENLDRENLSPMDMATAIRKMLDAGMSKTEVRNEFTRPGGRKGLAMQPMSNSLLNIYLSFLEFPKPIQAKIHDGLLPVSAAYTLSRKPREQWEKIIADAEAARVRAIEDEAKEDAKLEEAERKAVEQTAKLAEAKKALEQHEQVSKQWEEEASKKTAEAAELYKQAAAQKEKEKKQEAEKAFRAMQAEAKVAETKANDAKKEAEKLQKRLDDNAKMAAEKAAKLEQARKEQVHKSQIKKEDVEKASQAINGGRIPLNAVEMRAYINTMSSTAAFPKTQLIGKVIKAAFGSDLTESQMLSEIAILVGERKRKPGEPVPDCLAEAPAVVPVARPTSTPRGKKTAA